VLAGLVFGAGLFTVLLLGSLTAAPAVLLPVWAMVTGLVSRPTLSRAEVAAEAISL